MENILFIIFFVIVWALMHGLQDLLQYSFDETIFSKLPEKWDRLKEYLKPDPLRKYKNRDGINRKKILGIRIHVAFFEGYKLAQALREGAPLAAISIAQNIINPFLCFAILAAVLNAAFYLFYETTIFRIKSKRY